MAHTTQLLIIDPQNDFCDLPAAWWPRTFPDQTATIQPALPVTGAHADMQRLTGWIDRHSDSLDGITVTLDSHQAYDIAHPAFWQRRGGNPVQPFTTITAEQVRAGDFIPNRNDELPRTLAYLDQLEAESRYTLMVWPLHCEIGSWGHAVHADVLAACRNWQAMQHRAVRHVFKGMNPFTEHYSAIRAEVPDPQDPDTGLNRTLLQHLAAYDTLVIAGEASSHCVRSSTEHIVEHSGIAAERIVLLTDCMSPVTGFEAAHSDFLQQMRTLGVRCTTSDQFNL